MFALLTDFFLRWNQNIDIRVRGLDEKYDGLYDGDLLEREIEKMSAWNDREAPPHPEWISSRNLQSTGEEFGFIDPVPQKNVADESDSDKSLTNLAEDAAEEIAELDDDDIVRKKEFLNNLPASAQWMARLHGKFRSTGRVKTSLEWEYFEANIMNFQGRGNDEADNYSAFQFSAFAESWNKWVDSLKFEHPGVPSKNCKLPQGCIQINEAASSEELDYSTTQH